MSVPPSHRAVTDGLVAELTPVRRLWPFGARFAVWTGAGAAMLAVVAGTSCRPDIAARLHDPWFVAHLTVLLVAAAVVGGLALRAAVPGGEPRGAVLNGAAGLTAVALLLGLAAPSNPVSADVFVARGITCVLWTVVFATPPWVGLMLALRRGAPIAPRIAAGCAGAAAVLLAAGVLRTACPIEDRWHLAAWHLAPVVLAAATSFSVAESWLRRWRTC